MVDGCAQVVRMYAESAHRLQQHNFSNFAQNLVPISVLQVENLRMRSIVYQPPPPSPPEHSTFMKYSRPVKHLKEASVLNFNCNWYYITY